MVVGGKGLEIGDDGCRGMCRGHVERNDQQLDLCDCVGGTNGWIDR